MLVKYAPRVGGTRDPICKRNEASVSRIRGTSTPYDGMVERLQIIGSGPRDQEFRITVGRYRHLFGPESPFYHVGKFFALRAARALFPSNILDAGELRVFKESEVPYAATYSGFVGDDNGAVGRRTEAMGTFYGTQFPSREAEMEFAAAVDNKEFELNPELLVLPDRLMRAGMEINHPEANYHLSNGATVFFEINNIDLEKAATAALEAGAKPAMEAVATIYALLVHLEARNRVESQIWYGQNDDERRLMKERYEDVAESPPHDTYMLVFNLLSDLRDNSAMKLPDVFIRLGLIQLARELGPSLIDQAGQGMDWGAPARFQVDSSVIAAMYEENCKIRKQKVYRKA